MSTTGCCRGLSAQDCIARPYGCSDEPTLAQSDADASGLIEAAELAIEGLLSEWDKLSRYGSPMARAANERVMFARKVLSELRARAADRSK